LQEPITTKRQLKEEQDQDINYSHWGKAKKNYPPTLSINDAYRDLQHISFTNYKLPDGNGTSIYSSNTKTSAQHRR